MVGESKRWETRQLSRSVSKGSPNVVNVLLNRSYDIIHTRRRYCAYPLNAAAGAHSHAVAASVEVGVAVEAVLCLWATDVTTWPPFASIDAMIAEAEAWESNTVVAGSSDTVMLGVEEGVAVTVTTTVCVTTEGTDVAP